MYTLSQDFNNTFCVKTPMPPFPQLPPNFLADAVYIGVQTVNGQQCDGWLRKDLGITVYDDASTQVPVRIVRWVQQYDITYVTPRSFNIY